MENKDRIIDSRQVAKYWRSKCLIIIIASFIGMLLVAGYDYMKQKKNVDSANKSALEAAMAQNHDAFYKLNPSITYTDANQPKGIYNSLAKLYIDFNYSDVESFEKTDFAQLNLQFENDALALVWNQEMLEEVIADCNLRSYDDMSDITADKLQWLINKNFQGAHLMNIVISDVDPQRAKAIGDSLVNKFTTRVKEFMGVDNVQIVNEPTLPAKSGLFTSEAGVQDSVSKKELAKYGIVGFALGLIMSMVVLFMIFIFVDAVRSEDDIEFIGLKSILISRKKNVDYERIAKSINLYDDIKSVLFVSVDGHTDAAGFVDEVGKELKKLNKDKTLDAAADYKSSSDAIEKVKKNDGVVYLIKNGKTRLDSVTTAKNMLDRSEAKCLGGIIL